ncbi:Plant transposase (Ptta/En/Spm family) [Carex littledalei]|uniref:Plant transposase (Ptta/En/Spm family) n=1 Tax=Carex littledalei TaxID=544730 RepID=A0A833QFP4_9POAL|nr:Plant transposase (Ptta/En/Spm family) [Carex littledalei]
MAFMASQPPPPVPNPPLPLEVRCLGCGETLEVEPGLTEFVCPDCHTPQALPPELMPRKRKALPLIRSVDSRKVVQLPCGSCSVLLNVPCGLSRFVCPTCGVELAVDQEKLKAYLDGFSVAGATPVGVTPVIPCAVRLPHLEDVEPQIQMNGITHISRAPVPFTVNVGQIDPIASPVAVSASAHVNHKQSGKNDTDFTSPITRSGKYKHPFHNYSCFPVCSDQYKHASCSCNCPLVCSDQHKLLPHKDTSPLCVTAEEDRVPSRSILPSVNVEQVEEEVAPTPPPTLASTSKRSKQGEQQLMVFTTSSPPDDPEPSLRRSKRLAKSPAIHSTRNNASKNKEKKQKQAASSSGQSQPGQGEHNDSQPEPQDIGRHLYSMDFGQLLDSCHQHADMHIHPSSGLHPHVDSTSESPLHSHLHDPSPESHMDPSSNLQPNSISDTHLDQSPDHHMEHVDTISDDEGDETYVDEPYSGQSEHESASLQTLSARKGSGATTGRRSRRVRGLTRCIDLWSSSDNDPVEIEFNHLGQPIGIDPVEIDPSKFKVEEFNRKFIMRALGRHWSRWKCSLKQLHYDTHDNNEDRLADINKRIIPAQWPFLVHFWSSEEGQKRSAVGKASRSTMKSLHTTGSKSFARIREEERLKRPNKKEPSREEMFILTHTRKDGTPVDEEAARIIARLREELKKAQESNNTDTHDDILAKVLHEMDNPGLAGGYGLLPSKAVLLGVKEPSGPSSDEKARIIAEARRLADEETKPVREKMEEMEKRHEEMAKRHKEMMEEMDRMRSTMMAMQQSVSAQDNTGPVLLGFGRCTGTQHNSR